MLKEPITGAFDALYSDPEALREAVARMRKMASGLDMTPDYLSDQDYIDLLRAADPGLRYCFED